MATHDYVLNDASGAAFRSDLNNCLDAIVTQNVTTDGNPPATVKDWMIWTDVQGEYRKIYNADTSSWVKIAKLDGGAEYSGDVQFKKGSSVQAKWDSSESALKFSNYVAGSVLTRLTFGANFADNVQIFHDGSTRIYANVGSVVTNLITAGTDFRIHSGASNTSNHLAKFSRGGGVKLYWDGTEAEKFATTSTGVAVDGLITANTMTLASDLTVSGALEYGTTGNKALNIPVTNLTDATENYTIQYKSGSNFESALKATVNAGVELFHNGFRTLETLSNGARVRGPGNSEAHLELWSDDGDENSDKWRFVINTAGVFHFQNYASGAWHTNAIANGGGNVSLWHNNSSKLATTSGGVEVTGIAHATTGYTWGTAPHYLSAPSATEANLRIGSTSGSHLYARFAYDPIAGDFEIGNKSGNVLVTVGDESTREKAIRCINNSSVELYWNGEKEFWTHEYGATVRRNFDIQLTTAGVTSDCTLQIGNNPFNVNVGDHNAFIDFISQNQTDNLTPDYNLRLIRYAGVNGGAKLRNNGTGTLTIEAGTAGGKIDFSGYSFATASAWVHFNGTNTATVTNSYKISSLTDNGTGDYSVNFTTALIANNGSATDSVCAVFQGNGPINEAHAAVWLHDVKSTYVRVQFYDARNSTRKADPSVACGAFFS